MIAIWLYIISIVLYSHIAEAHDITVFRYVIQSILGEGHFIKVAQFAGVTKVNFYFLLIGHLLETVYYYTK